VFFFLRERELFRTLYALYNDERNELRD